MSTTLSRAPIDQRRDVGTLTAVVVAVLVVAVDLLVEHYEFQVLAHVEGVLRHLGTDLAMLVVILPRWALLAAFLAWWGRTPAARRAGTVVALAGALAEWAAQELLFRMSPDHLSQGLLRSVDWTMTLLLPTLVALAWGLARRSGRSWPLGLLLAPLLAGLRYYALEHSSLWMSRFYDAPWLTQRLVLVVPPLAACLTCWWLDVQERRDALAPHDEPEPV